MRCRSYPLAVTLLAFALPALANDGGFKRCRAVKDPAQRLACYDAMPLADSPAAPVAPPAASPRGSAPSPGAAVAPAAQPAESGEGRFGLERRTPTAELPTIES